MTTLKECPHPYQKRAKSIQSVGTKRRQRRMKRHVAESVVVAVVLTSLSYAVGIGVHWISDLNWLEVFAVFTSYSCTYLCVKERRINYPIGAISSVAYVVLFLQADLVASAVLNAYLVPTLVYGWIRWRRDDITRPVTHVKLKWVPLYVVVAVTGYLGASLLSKAFDGSMAWADSVILAGTILAQFMLDNKKIENWAVWAVVNVFAIYTYATSGLPLVAFQYVLFLANTVYGYVSWNRSMKDGHSICSDDSYATNNGPLAVGGVR